MTDSIMDATPPELSVSVTTLADFSCKQGDLVWGGVTGPSAAQGIRAHQRLQQQSTAQTEVTIWATLRVAGVDVTLRGRMDELDIPNRTVTEIKSTLVPPEHLPRDVREQQAAQLRLYGYCVLNGQTDIDLPADMDSLSLTLLYINLRNNETFRIVEEQSADQLKEFTHQAVQRYVEWWLTVDKQVSAARDALLTTTFPHDDFRAGQRALSAAIYRCIRDGNTLLGDAPTGIGKSISSIFPALKAFAENHIKQVIYLTAKSSGAASAIAALTQLANQGAPLTAVVLRAKQSTCFCLNGRVECDEAGVCPMTQGFHDRLPAARRDAFAAGLIDGETLDDIAWQHQVCPFELALQLLPWVNVAVADYNYVFDPLVRLSWFAERRLPAAVLIDEAHNLAERARSMYSAELSRLACREVAGAVRHTHQSLARQIERLSEQLLEEARSSKALVSYEESTDGTAVWVSDLCPRDVVRSAGRVIEHYMNLVGKPPALPAIANGLFRDCCRFVAIAELYGDVHRSFGQLLPQGRYRQVVLRLRCLDASVATGRQCGAFHARCLFSGTLRPAAFIRDSLGLGENTQQLSVASPFSKDHVRHIVVPWINTRYRQREKSLPLLVDLIDRTRSVRPGNYMVCLPSYAYLQRVYDAFIQAHPSAHTWLQPRENSADARDEMLQKLDSDERHVIFAISGGVLGEGIDYRGDRLCGVVIVGVGIPPSDRERELIAARYVERGLDGYTYAYQYPGLIRVLQSAGRVIRGESDTGVIVLVDDRFLEPFYRQGLPGDWHVEIAHDRDELQAMIEQFRRQCDALFPS